MTDLAAIRTLYHSIDMEEPGVDTARLVVNHNEVLGSHLVPGLEVDTQEKEDGIDAVIRVRGDVRIDKPVHICFGMIPERGMQKIGLNIRMERNSRAALMAHCTFPFAVDVTHRMDAEIVVEDGAEYTYFERHVHGAEGGVVVLPKAHVKIGRGARFKTEFELIKGRVGKIDVDYEADVAERGVLEMTARIFGRGTDDIRINEVGRLMGEDARGVLTSYIALRDQARAAIHNTLEAHAARARGHVDCKEIVQDQATASAIPIVDVRHPKAHVTHEASIGSVDAKQLQTLMARGLTEDDAVDLIIEGLLS